MLRTRENEKLIDALEALEACLETPHVPGELPEWSDSVERAARAVLGPLKEQIEGVHAASLAEIEQQDAELFKHVEDLRKGDAESLERFEAFCEHLSRFTASAGDIEPDEKTVDDSLDALVEEGLALVVHVRRQEVALSTWMLEAFERDRGTVD